MQCVPRTLRRLLSPSRCSASAIRSYAVQAPGGPNFNVFDRNVKYMQRERAASDTELSRKVDYLRDEVASRLCERLLDINRFFPHVLDLGANACNIARILTRPDPDNYSSHPVSAPLKTKVGQITAADSSPSLLHRDDDLPFNDSIPIVRDVIDTEESLPYEPESFDAVLSSLSLHWINDLPSTLRQINQILKPDAPFLGVMFGGDTLFELRTSLQLAELDRRGGVAPHTSPLADVRDVGGLLQRAGFQLLTVDVDDIIVEYPDMFSLMKDLQAMGESNAVLGREHGPISRDILAAAEGIYRELHAEDPETTGNSGGVPATFRLIYMIGWKAGPNQQQPLERGSGMVSIKDVLEGQKSSGNGDGGKSV
ncbi:S-adenosyl-L-methionine-dependent methyltransferase [Rhizodiscina lignyota]|uniref:S-adenosyl-L-methionine-dependent methyltransferase n=1 Tax=Rhizodiscina lignyota TaxID=1504668 RepID=A0A9P4IMF0_9PEZI|nr:S-adenosyl-L-methionine-dependent methyltransferase [Rhizodiscina lignyota]